MLNQSIANENARLTARIKRLTREKRTLETKLAIYEKRYPRPITAILGGIGQVAARFGYRPRA